MESKDADRTEITLREHVDAVVAAIDFPGPADDNAVLVGHPQSVDGLTGE